ncbi:hypothetical protein ACFORH_16635 [Amycolatopsis roodepoortensis]|uniref:PASTA domain-containing protein n=1 Tax=Amycolatopsis roodepoortensis TaxID=700274 RepID=A0ABR9LCP0_9PSEU|nr:hypothetical protein [Amycolatopsis roodepoortensis]MBE1578080.1 hypothetical protein [Amycolatopsis roodepoortensis]
MKRLFGTALVIAALGFAAACGGASTPRDTAPGDLTTDSGVPTETAPTASSEVVPTKDSPPPGVVPGSPIKYNSDLLGTDPETAKRAIEQNLERLCESSRRCGVTVVIADKEAGNCIRSIGPNPVRPGKKITIQARTCETESSAPSKSESEQPSETTGG